MKKRNYTTVITMFMFILLFCSKNVYADDAPWQNSYQYRLDSTNHQIILEKYIGSEKNITIPAEATIDGVKYTTYMEGGSEGKKWEGVESIRFEEGVKSKDDLSKLFSSSYNLKSLDLKGLDTSNVTDMRSMFGACHNLPSLNMGSLDTSNVTNMSYMFSDCKSLTSLDLSSFDTSNVEKMVAMFAYCTSLTSVDMSSFDTSKLTDPDAMDDIFTYCKNLTSIKTPLNLDINGGLPGTFYDKSGAAYTKLPKNMTTSILLTRTIQDNQNDNNSGSNSGNNNNNNGGSNTSNNNGGNNINNTTTKQSQSMTVKATKKTVKAKKLKKKKQVISPITVKNAQGTVSYKITGGNKKSKKALKINAKNGKITVKKKTKKGTYKVKVKVTAAGNKSYNAGSKTVTVEVVVK